MLMQYAKVGSLYQKLIMIGLSSRLFSLICNEICSNILCFFIQYIYQFLILVTRMIVLSTLKQYNSYRSKINILDQFARFKIYYQKTMSAKVGYNKQRDTLCGTVYYMAPEINYQNEWQYNTQVIKECG
ncbi:unnamed protein product [Paramecium pentaurelia]|uniref:Uncharacterized protein n=1 Tax=Paramecium pentaurelia TaxID=43138 RepID=A0A8S1U802_9CILI|nr:unnamed protein product [Paramecium pentaurelia]